MLHVPASGERKSSMGTIILGNCYKWKTDVSRKVAEKNILPNGLTVVSKLSHMHSCLAIDEKKIMEIFSIN